MGRMSAASSLSTIRATLARVRQPFPQGCLTARRVTPSASQARGWPAAAFPALGLRPLLRTHCLVQIDEA